MNKKYIVALVVLILVIGLFAFRGGKKDTGTIKIGFISPLTGEVSNLGLASKAAAEIARDEINTAGGINGRKIELISEDGKCNPKDASTAAQKLVSIDGVTAIVGGLCSGETGAIIPIAKEKKVVTISTCSSAPNLSGISPYFFRTYPSDVFEGKAVADYMYTTLGKRKVAVLYHVSEWGNGVKDIFIKRFTELGGTIVAEEGASIDTRDYRTALQKIKVAKPEYVYAALYPEGGIVVSKQINQLGITAPLFGSGPWGDAKFQKEAFSETPILYSTVKTPQDATFNEKVKAITQADAPLCSTQAYDNVKIFARVMSKVGTDGDAIAKELHLINYTGLSGPISYDEKGDLKVAEYVIQKLEKGVVTEVK